MAYRLAFSSRYPALTFSWRRAIVLLGFVIVLYGVLPQLADFKQSLALLQHVPVVLFLVGLLLVMLTFLVAAFVLSCLALKSLDYRRVVMVQGASGFANRLLPAGLGSLGLNAAYLYRSRHTVAQAGTVVLINNIVGFAGHLLLLGGMLALMPASRRILLPHVSGRTELEISLGLLGLVCLALYVAWRSPKIGRQLKAIRHACNAYVRRPQAVVRGLGASMILTLLNGLILFVCTQAVGLKLPFVSVFIAFTLEVFAATITPTPGGLGGAEVGLAAALAAYSAPADAALAAALLYRLFTYWLPIIPGFVWFSYIVRHKYLG